MIKKIIFILFIYSSFAMAQDKAVNIDGDNFRFGEDEKSLPAGNWQLSQYPLYSFAGLTVYSYFKNSIEIQAYFYENKLIAVKSEEASNMNISDITGNLISGLTIIKSTDDDGFYTSYYRNDLFYISLTGWKDVGFFTVANIELLKKVQSEHSEFFKDLNY